MFKSSAIATLRLVYQLSRIHQKTGIQPQEIREIWQHSCQNNFNRRRFLKRSLAFSSGLAASLLANKTVNANGSKTANILIVGAGIAGLTAAYRLKQAGVNVDIIEARNRVGGRISSLQIPDRITVELGGEFINSDHRCLLNLARELDLKIVDLYETETGLTSDIFYDRGRQISLAEMVNDFIPVATQISKDLKILENFETYATKDPKIRAIDSLSITEYLNNIPEASSTIKNIIEVGYTPEYGLDADKQSCLNLLYLISNDPGQFSILGSSDERFYIDGGNDRITKILGDRLANNIETGTALKSITMLADARYRVDLSSGKTRKYERILLTIPFSILRNIPLKNMDLSPIKKIAIDTLGYGTNSKLITSYKSKLWRDRYKSTGTVYANLDFQTTWETSASRYNKNRAFITNYTGGRQGLSIGTKSPNFHKEKFIVQFARVFPDIDKELENNFNPIRAYWYGEEYNRGSYSCYLAGQWTTFYGVEKERIKNIFFAGEHTSREFQGYMEGGCETGEAAALEIMEDLGLKASASLQKNRLLKNKKYSLISRKFKPFSS